jgi:ABC-type glycerol-3-phosphate transport system substrate-binding protein
MEEQMWPAAFTAVDVPGGKVYYIPWLAGIRGAAMTVNTAHLAEQSIDYLNFGSFEELVDAGKALTQTNSDGKVTRSGFSPRSSQYQLLWSLIWQLGGNFFDRESGQWSHNTPEGEAAAQILYDIYWTHQTCDFELFTSEFEAVSQQLVSIWGDGAWTAGVQTDVAEVPCDNIVTPYLANAVEQVLYPQHMAGFGLSKRLANDPDKLQAALDFALLLTGPDAIIQAFDFYSGVGMAKAVYEDPRIEEVKYGLMSKRVATGMWPVARYPQDHVAQQGPAATELDRAMRQEITIQEALANMDAYLQEQEDQARERLGM